MESLGVGRLAQHGRRKWRSFVRLHSFPLFLQRAFLCLGAVLLPGAALAQLTVNVVDDAGTPISNFRWILQEDISHPGVPYVQKNDTVSIVAHTSDARVIATGHATSSTWPIRVPKYSLPKLVPDGTKIAGATPPSYPYNNATYDVAPDATKKYVIEVMASGYSMGGQLVATNQHEVTVVMNRNPLPTTQISILVFHDHMPLDNEPGAEEEGLPGFRIKIYDMLGGPYIQDAFANPIGTEYATDSNGNYIPDPDTVYKILKKGDGYLYTDKDGKALIKNLWNHKFGIEAIPPTGENWNGGHASLKTSGYAWQTATIEGTPTVDAWGAANGARVFIEGWGSGYYHVFFGFCDPAKLTGAAPQPGSGVAGVKVKGRLIVNHYGRPPATALLADGPPVTDGWVGLNIADVAVEGTPPVEGVDRATLPANTAVWAQPCDPESGEFTINNVAPGNYQLVSWDRPLDFIFNAIDIGVPPNGDPRVVNGVYDIGDIKVVRWFGSMQGSVFYDANGNGFPDSGEEYIPQVPLNLRFRDGSMYQTTQTKADGTYSFTEIFPFFKWLVAEVDNTRWKPTGMTSVVDDGGTIPPDAGWAMPSGDINDSSLWVRNPQTNVQVDAHGAVIPGATINNLVTGNPLSRTQTSASPSEPLVTQAVQIYNGQYDRLDWGKANYAPGQSGGIQGSVSYNNTRAEADPRYGTQELWDPGIARVQVALYQYETNFEALAAAAAAGKQTVYNQPYDINLWKIKIQRSGATYPRLADVDNYPFGWAGGGARGPEDVDRDDPTHTAFSDAHPFNPGDAIQITHTDSWDDDVAAQTDPAFPNAGGWPAGTIQPNPPVIQGRKIIGSDNFATWEQIRPGVFDGAYVLNSYHPGGITSGSAEVPFLPPGDYIVQASPPRGYLIQTEESRNIVYGDAYQPGKLDIPAECVGDFHFVPAVLDLFPDQEAPADFANQWRPLADRKLVTVVESRNAPCSFNMYTEVPKVGHVVGFVLNDLSAEFNPNNPTYGEREGAAWIPVSLRDWAGHEVARTYSDEFGCYDAMVPSTYNAAVPCPSGFAPNMLTVVLNDPTMPADPAHPEGLRIPDPYYNPGYTICPIVLEYYPGKVNYADTPIVPIGAFVGGPSGQLDIEPTDGTPVIKGVAGTMVGTNAGPYVASLSDPVRITSMGPTQVLDPNYKLHGAPSPAAITRDYGFGNSVGTVTLVPTDRSNAGIVISSFNTWSDSLISFNLTPAAVAVGTTTATSGKEWQLMVTRSNGKTTPIGITLSYETVSARVHVVNPPPPLAASGELQPAAPPNTAIQDVIDAATPGDLVIVPTNARPWNEYLVVWKPIRLQGSGAGTVINGVPDPQSRVPAWHNKIVATLGDDPFVINECPAVTVFGETNSLRSFDPGANPGDTMFFTGFDTIPSRVDGFLFKGAIHGGAINAYDKASNLRISNNRITGNMGDTFNGGISLGAPAGGGQEGANPLAAEDPGSSTTYENTNVVIEYNYVVKNSSLDGGGGIAINSGANGYKIRNNYIMGNFAFDAPGAATAFAGSGMGGGGILHMGLSPGGLIANNVIAFNEVYFGYSTGGGDGAGICIQGEADGGSPTGTSGSGSVTIIGNLIMGNLAGGGLGGGIRLAGVNGPEMLDTNNLPVFENNPPWANPTLFPDDFVGGPSPDPNQWYEINIFNNIIVNNVAGYSGGGISIQDAIKVNIIGNTIANNDAPAVALNTFPPGSGVSVPQGAGIVSHHHTMAISPGTPAPYNLPYSNPVLRNNIIWHNRSFHFDYSLTGRTLDDPNNHQPIDDSGGLVYDGYVDLAVVGSGSMTPQDCILSISATPPTFASPYTNTLHSAIVYDEGGHNSISVRFDEISLYTPAGLARGDYHLGASTSPSGGNISAIAGLSSDYDGQNRPTAPDVGADQLGAHDGILPSPTNNASLPVLIVGVLPNPGSRLYAPTPAPVPGEVPHLAEGEPVSEANPLIPPGPQVPPPPLNPVWMTANPGAVAPLFVRGDILNVQSFLARLQNQGDTNAMTIGAQSDPVAKYVFDHLSGDWPPPPPADGEEPPAPRYTTKSLLSLWNGGWVKYVQRADYEPSDETMIALVLADMNAMPSLSRILLDLGQQGNTALSEGVRQNNRTAYAQLITNPAYTPSAASTRLFGSLPGQPGGLQLPSAARILAVQLLNRSVIQDGFTEIRRWYDPSISYVHLVCGDGMAVMADGTELYTFGFSDQTEVANNPSNDPEKGPDKVLLPALADAKISAPTMVVTQGQEFHLDLSNVGFAFRPDLFDPHTIHFHGFPNAAPIFDGMPLASVAVLNGATLPYYYKLNTEGTYFYHCHVEATEHMQQGMIGNLWVEASQNNTNVGASLQRLPSGKGTTHQAGYHYAYNDGDGSTYFDVEFPMQITGFDHYFHDQEMAIQPTAFATMFDTYPLLNGRGYPDTVKTTPVHNSLDKDSQCVSSLITAKQGQRILLRISNVSETEFDTLTVPGIPMTVVAKDARLLRGPDGKSLFYKTTSVTLGGGETTDVILDTTNTKPGTYFVYTARLNQLSNDQEDYGGMMTHIVINP
jgi:large repetitive protein